MCDSNTNSFKMAWRCNFAETATAADMPDVELDGISVIFNLHHRGGTVITSNWDPVPISKYLRGKQTASEPTDKKVRGPTRDEGYGKLVMQMPWLSHLDTTDSFMKAAEKKAKSASSASVDAEHVVFDDEEVLAALADVEKAMLVEATAAASAGTVDFVVSECRGESNLLKAKDYHDAVQGKCANKAAEDWSRNRKLQITYKMTFTEHTEELSRIVVRGWVHKMQWMYDQDLSSDSSALAFTPEVMAGYVEPVELTRVAESDVKKASTLVRINKVRSMIPK